MRAPATASHQSSGHRRHRTTPGRCSLGSVADRVRGLEHRRQAARRRRAPARVSALAGEGAGGGAAASSPTGHGGRCSSVAGERNGEGEKKWPVRVWGDAPPVLLDRDWRPAVGFDPTVWGRPPANQARSSPRGHAARAVSAARPSAAGPRAHARGSGRAETGLGPFSVSGRMNREELSFFLLFSEAFEYE